jgi:vacuolar-type H+-ATPase subunit H
VRSRRAERQSAQTVREAQARSDQIIREAEVYALEQLQQLEAHLSRTLATVKRGVESLQTSVPVEEPEAEGAQEAEARL